MEMCCENRGWGKHRGYDCEWSSHNHLEDDANFRDLESLEWTVMDDVMQAPLFNGTLKVWLYLSLYSWRLRELVAMHPDFVILTRQPKNQPVTTYYIYKSSSFVEIQSELRPHRLPCKQGPRFAWSHVINSQYMTLLMSSRKCSQNPRILQQSSNL